MHRRTARTNHVLLVIVGLLLIAGGGYLVARNRGRIDRQPAHARLYTHYESQWLHAHDWIWYAVAAAAVVVGLIALRWLLVQPRLDRVRTLHLDPDPGQHGRTMMAADVLTDAVEDEVAQLPGVNRVRALLTGSGDAPGMVLRVQAHPAADLVTLNALIVGEALHSLRTALDSDAVPVQVHLDVAGRDRSQRTVR